ncbi:ABC transporter ATP-binding protein [Leucobacter sp. OLJS4]|uniref:ABC transporter ATP-binding protein n=1 Tax=unclassified Leucobacter TaxID=2621730 RepID=UPI000C19FD59|nr:MULTISPECIES: ABC transporter ATP-binding protein [unclassified Leucobacter]PII86672.1 ABC transporter ATP-binding protein [Leucobacter sp. OLCALW19]PII88961.1 ABC transporter ATP-binding protein [Leucobacter sp. OLAS13]PII96050.1 ABC transporter ATP-binding protein [Leucobacter sp. OLTLW20]PII99324.1 ABC transporter ATP-binding protein [Leucobacter sp. OLDS2]PIJ01714.1 ABC transporter ATP-binding protein [Leucobacter sp. OLCS4]
MNDPTTGESPVLELRDVEVAFTSGAGAKRRTVRAMNGVSLSVAPGETLGLVGESGSGKTTTAAVALGLRRPDRGEVRLLGAPFPRSRRATAGSLQAVLQHPHWSLNPRRRVGESVREPLTVVRAGLSRSEQRQRVQRMLEQVGLNPALAERYPHELSGGQRQRVSVARALITEPRFIVFDEAVSALDVAVQMQILALIRDLQLEHRFGALFISHDLGAVHRVADRVAVLYRGDLVETAATDDFFRTPTHPYSQKLLETL